VISNIARRRGRHGGLLRLLRRRRLHLGVRSGLTLRARLFLVIARVVTAAAVVAAAVVGLGLFLGGDGSCDGGVVVVARVVTAAALITIALLVLQKGGPREGECKSVGWATDDGEGGGNMVCFRWKRGTVRTEDESSLESESAAATTSSWNGWKGSM
jgi:hypothetical protein